MSQAPATATGAAPGRRITIRCQRWHPQDGGAPHWQAWDVPFTDDMSLLQGLQHIKDELDGSLSFRWSCRMAICGSCGMMVNGRPQLACHVFLRDLWPGPVDVAPLAHFPVLRKAMNALPKDQLLLGSRDEVFDTFVRLHPLLKESFFLQTKEDDNDPYESSQFSVVIANASGIFGLYSYREVFEFKEFWGIGSGRGFALGAMHAVWDKARSAREVALAGVHAGCEFDRNSAGPVDLYTIKLKA